MKINRDKFFNIKQLKERGWTQSKINSWLKEPDATIANPIYRSASPSKLFLIARVKRQEKNKRFIEWIDKSKSKRQKLSKTLKEVNANKRRELIMYINSLNITIPKMSYSKLTKLAIEHYNDLWHSRGRYEKVATALDDRAFLNRICINMLRHEQEIYEEELYNLFGKIGKEEGYLILKEKVNSEICKIYPLLFEEIS